MTAETIPGCPEDGIVPVAAPLSRIMEDVDEVLLGEAQRLLGLSSGSDTINQALAELIRERRRRHAAEAQLQRFQAGHFAVSARTGGVR